MFSIKNSDITLTRGDSLFLQVEMNKNGNKVQPKEGESVRFAMKYRYTDPDEKVLIHKQIPLDTLLLEIKPEDTKPLKFNKTYVYDIQYTDIDGRVDTFINGTITLTEEVL